MTEQEARKIIGGITLDRVSEEETRALGIACKALEKQKPKKMNPNLNCIFCECGNPIYYQTDRLLHHYNYCCECGQRIEWDV